MEHSLHNAARAGDVQRLESLLREGAFIDTPNSKLWTPLYVASSHGKLDCARLLCAARAQVGSVDDQDQTPLHISAANGHTDVARLLVSCGADVRKPQSICNFQPLHTACRFGHAEVARVLIEARAAVDVPVSAPWSHMTPLHMASFNGHAECVQLLITASANVDRPCSQGRAGQTALYLACEKGSAACAQLLIQANATIDRRSALGGTPLHVACLQGNAGCVAELLAARADINVTSRARGEDNAALQWAEIGRNSACIDLVVGALNATGIAYSRGAAQNQPRTVEWEDGLQWESMQPASGCLEWLLTSASVRAAVPRIDQIVDEVAVKIRELRQDPVAQPVASVLDDDELAAIIAYTHDLRLPGGQKRGNLYYELNKALREQAPAQVAQAWGTFVHFAVRGLAKLPRFPHSTLRAVRDVSPQLISSYYIGMPIQWRSFLSTTTSESTTNSMLEGASGGLVFNFCSGGAGVRVDDLSFVPLEIEVLIPPGRRFIVCSRPYTNVFGHTTIDIGDPSVAPWLHPR